MKKKILTIALAVALVALAGYSTLAYFTATDTAINTITAGKLKIAINEYESAEQNEPSATDDDGITLKFENVKPGDTVPKIAKVESLEGNIDAFLRVKVDVAWTLDTENNSVNISEGFVPSADIITLNLDDGWTLDKGYYYYENVVSGDTEIDFLNGVYFDFDNMGNEYQGAVLTITITAEAVQSQNNSAANGWPAAEDTTTAPDTTPAV